jgi:DNA topoisomerase VI subunit A
LCRASGNRVSDREEFYTSEDVIVFLRDQDSVNLVLSDRVSFLAKLGPLAINGQECFY